MSTTTRVNYPTKIGTFIYVLITFFGSISLAGYLLGEWRVGLVFTALTLLFLWMAYGTKYWVEDELYMVVKAPIYGSAKVPIARITKVYASGNPLSSPAPSLDRFAIHYDKSGLLLISPTDKEALTKHLLRINPNIQLKQKS